MTRLPSSLEGLSKAQLEAMCVDCGLCCYAAVPLSKGHVLVPDLRCKHLCVEQGTAKSTCSVYDQRAEVAKGWCMQLPEAIEKGAFPSQCPYVSNLPGYVGSEVLSDMAYQLVLPQLQKTLGAQGRPPWVNPQHWDVFLNKAAYRGRGRREGTPGNYTYHYDDDSGPTRSKTAENPVNAAVISAVADGNWAAARGALSDFLFGQGNYYEQGSPSGRTSDETLVRDQRATHVAGVHKWDGTIEISPRTAKGAQEFAKAWSKDPKGVTKAMKKYETLSAKIKTTTNKLRVSLKKQTALDAKHDKLWESVREPNSRVDPLFASLDPTVRDKIQAVYTQLSDLENARTGLQEQLKTLAAARNSAEADDGLEHLRNSDHFKVLIHEMYHGYGPLQKEAYVGVGAVTEEVTTEVLARRDMVKNFGVPKSWTRRGGSYQEWVGSVVQSIEKVHGVSEAKAWDILENASDSLKEKSDGGDNEYSMMTYFIMQMAPTGDVAKDKPLASLTGPDPTSPGEWVDRSTAQYEMGREIFNAKLAWQPDSGSAA